MPEDEIIVKKCDDKCWQEGNCTGACCKPDEDVECECGSTQSDHCPC